MMPHMRNFWLDGPRMVSQVIVTEKQTKGNLYVFVGPQLKISHMPTLAPFSNRSLELMAGFDRLDSNEFGSIFNNICVMAFSHQ
jgi:hypothetical protein